MAGDERKILIVEDDAGIADGLILNLKLEGFATRAVADGEAALQTLSEEAVELILLDITLPKMSGLEVLRALRDGGDSTPIIMLSARQDEYDKVAALRLGADDYVTKPFGVAELLARVDSVLRRSATAPASDANSARSGTLRFASITIDVDRRLVTRQSQRVSLTHLEFELLAFLAQNAAKVFTRQELLRSVWGVEHTGSPRTVDNFIAQLRNKIEDDPNNPRHIVTVRGSGYRLEP